MTGELRTNKDVFIETLLKGFLPTKHAKDIILKELRKQKRIKGNPPMGYDSIFRKKNIQRIELI
ncbi:MAG: hypothetical protein SVO01_09265 [Thermotogota bacterium]|nr:hypothetical protein [Thermotogota bacterium]